MNRYTRIVANTFILSITSILFAQVTVSGTVTDASSGDALAGANVVVDGTNLGAAADANGGFTINDVPDGSTLTASMIGYSDASTTASTTVNFSLTVTTLQLSAVTVAGNFAIERETPVAFTTIGEEHIKNNFTVQDVPHLFANTPGVYVTSDGGSGMGDSKVTIRGFDEQRIAVMINNVPVNDPESKKVYWSNWGSLPAASQSIQIQRGVGSSLYGSGALGGSINVITKDAPADKNIGLSFSAGQYGILKAGIDYESGLIGGNKALIARFNYLEGNGWRDDTFYRGLQYYFSAMLYPNDRNTFKIILHGAPQYHAYSYYGFSPAAFATKDQIDMDGSISGGTGDKDKYGAYAYGFGRTWNGHPHVAESDLSDDEANRATNLIDVLFNKTPIGSADSQIGGWIVGNDRASLDNNVYHKPQFEIHHSLRMSADSRLTNTLFISKGYGYGENLNSYYSVPRNEDGSMSFAVIDTGGFYGDGNAYQYRNYSDHFQTGLMSSYESKLGAHDITAGVELRYWKARHAGEILNTFSHQDQINYYIGNVKHYFKENDLYYDYTTTKPQLTGFGHGLWRFGDLSLMTDVQFSNVSYHLLEDVPSSGNYPGVSTFTDADGKDVDKGTETWTGSGNVGSADTTYYLFDYEKSYTFVSPKLGVNYNISNSLNVFANWSSAVNEPRVKYFFGYGSPNDALELETTSDLELGFGYRGELAGLPLDAKLNWYNIDFEGKALRIQDPTKANTQGYDYKGRRYIPIGAATYTGIELALNADLPMGLDLGVNFSSTANEWGEPDGSEGAQYLYSRDAVVAGTDYTDTDDDGGWDAGEVALHKDFVGKFGNKVEVAMPQMIYGGTLNWSSGPLSVGLAMRHYEDLYVLENNSEVTVNAGNDGKFGNDDDETSATLPPATVVDAVLRYNLNIMGGLNLSLHINNILDTEYWQTGDSYGFKPGAAQTVILNIGVGL